MKDFLIKYNLFIIVLIVYLFFHFYTPFFSTSFNLLTLAREGAELGIICIAVTLVLILGRLDISVGSIMAVSAMIMILGFKSFEISWIILIFVCIFFGFIVGSINGILSAGCFDRDIKDFNLEANHLLKHYNFNGYKIFITPKCCSKKSF